MVSVNKDLEFFSDFTRSFLAHPDNKQISRVTNEAAVNQSIRNLIMTNKYERFFNPTLGSSIRNFLFEPISPQTEAAIRSAIKSTIEKYERRVSLLDVKVSAIADRNTYMVTIIYSINSSPNPITLSLPLQRIR